MKLEEVFRGRRSGFVIAEVAQAHDGSLGTAHAYIEAAARAGADAVKFQTHIAAEESTKREPWRVRFSPQDETRYEYWKRLEFTEQQWAGSKEHAEACGSCSYRRPFPWRPLRCWNGLEWKPGKWVRGR